MKEIQKVVQKLSRGQESAAGGGGGGAGGGVWTGTKTYRGDLITAKRVASVIFPDVTFGAYILRSGSVVMLCWHYHMCSYLKLP